MDATLEGLKELLASVQPDAQGNARLPTERELARRLEVQRSTVRERLAALEALGLIRRTQGSGTYLSLPDSAFVQLYFELALRLGYFSAAQLGEARELIEREVARLAATQATAEDLEALEAAYTGIAEASSVEAGDEADYAFHQALCRAAHNPVVSLLMDGLASVRHAPAAPPRRTRSAGRRRAHQRQPPPADRSHPQPRPRARYGGDGRALSGLGSRNEPITKGGSHGASRGRTQPAEGEGAPGTHGDGAADRDLRQRPLRLGLLDRRAPGGALLQVDARSA
jgi:GntR family transcriptional regulator, transcriptional repressor for pyruvate dehydrogenase complex